MNSSQDLYGIIEEFLIPLYIFSFNKQEDDFETLRDYNDYLEMIETIGKY